MTLRIICSIIFGLLCGSMILIKKESSNMMGCSIICFIIAIFSLILVPIVNHTIGENQIIQGAYSAIAYLILGGILLISSVFRNSNSVFLRTIAFVLIGGLCGYLFFLLIKILLMMIIITLLAFMWCIYSLFR